MKGCARSLVLYALNKALRPSKEVDCCGVVAPPMTFDA